MPMNIFAGYCIFVQQFLQLNHQSLGLEVLFPETNRLLDLLLGKYFGFIADDQFGDAWDLQQAQEKPVDKPKSKPYGKPNYSLGPNHPWRQYAVKIKPSG